MTTTSGQEFVRQLLPPIPINLICNYLHNKNHNRQILCFERDPAQWKFLPKQVAGKSVVSATLSTEGSR